MEHQAIIIISDGEQEEEDGEEEGGTGSCRPRKRRRWRPGSRPSSPPADLIDLTEDDSGVGGVQHNHLGVIDLTTLEEVEDMLSSSDSSLDCSSGSPHCEDDCLFVKESGVKNSSLPDSSSQRSPLPELKVIYDDMSVDSSLDSSSSVSTSSDSNSSGCGFTGSNQSPSCSQPSCTTKDELSDSGTAVNSDMGSLDSPDTDRCSRTTSSSSGSIPSSLDSLLEDLPDSTSKNSRSASPAPTDAWAENTCLDHQTASVEIRAIASSRDQCGRLEDSCSLDYMRGFFGGRASLEISSCANFRVSCERLAVTHPVFSCRKSCDIAQSLDHSPHVPSRLFHSLHIIRTTCNEKQTVENLPQVTSIELSDSKQSQRNYFHVSHKESSDCFPTVEHLPHVTSSQSFEKTSIGNHCLRSSSECGDGRPSIENLPQIAHCKSNDQPQGINSPLLSRKESSDGRAPIENLPHVTSYQSGDNKSSIRNSSPMFHKDSDDSRSSLEELCKVSNNKLVNNHFVENASCISSNGHVSEGEPLASNSGISNNWSSKVPLVCTGSSPSRLRLETPPPHEPSSNNNASCTVLNLPQPNTSSQEDVTVKPQSSSIVPVPQRLPSPKAILGPTLPSMAWLNKLKYFRKLPIQHLFYQGLKQDEEMCKNRLPLPISNRRMNMVNTTIEEGFAHGTLQFLMDFVSPQHYAKKETVSHVIRNILLGKEDPEILPDAYTVLIKIQQFHPADVSTVGWDWKLLSEVMDAENTKMPGRLLFLRYALQTLDDDFQKNLVRRTLQKSIAKTMLSCDQHLSNVRDVIRWLTDAVTWCSSEADPSSVRGSWPDTKNQNLMTVCILQQMLSMAVEVDKSPTISSSKMAEIMFQYVLNIRQRLQRDTFFNTMASHLLRGKLLEMMFDHSCESPPGQALSRTKVLYFLEHSTLLLEGQGADTEWQRWDELLHHIYLLFVSHESILFERWAELCVGRPAPAWQAAHSLTPEMGISRASHCATASSARMKEAAPTVEARSPCANHLRFPLTERVDLTIRKSKPQPIKADIISKQDVDEHMGAFCRRITRGHDDIPDAQLLERIQVLRTVLYTAVQ